MVPVRDSDHRKPQRQRSSSSSDRRGQHGSRCCLTDRFPSSRRSVGNDMRPAAPSGGCRPSHFRWTAHASSESVPEHRRVPNGAPERRPPSRSSAHVTASFSRRHAARRCLRPPDAATVQRFVLGGDPVAGELSRRFSRAGRRPGRALGAMSARCRCRQPGVLGHPSAGLCYKQSADSTANVEAPTKLVGCSNRVRRQLSTFR